jgi:hypothetical protein
VCVVDERVGQKVRAYDLATHINLSAANLGVVFGYAARRDDASREKEVVELLSGAGCHCLIGELHQDNDDSIEGDTSQLSLLPFTSLFSHLIFPRKGGLASAALIIELGAASGPKVEGGKMTPSFKP